jgi:tetratricopeptide (TPR) repeat protein
MRSILAAIIFRWQIRIIGDRAHQSLCLIPCPKPFACTTYGQRMLYFRQESIALMYSKPSWPTTFLGACLLLLTPFHIRNLRANPLWMQPWSQALSTPHYGHSMAGQTASQPRDLIASADAALRADHPLDALGAYREALRLEPGSEGAEIGIAKAYQRLANFSQARAWLQQCISQHPQSAAPLLAWAESDIEMQQYSAAMNHLNEALQKSPQNLTARLDRATVERVQGQLNAAESDLQAAATLKGAALLPYWHYLRASVYADRSQDLAALKEARLSVSLAPANLRAKALLARLMIRTHRCAGAAALLKEPAPQPGGARGEWLYLRARAFQCLQDKAAAAAAMRTFNEYTESREAEKQSRAQAEFLVTRAGQMALRNQLSGALDLCKQALHSDPENAKAWAQAAKIYFSLGQISQAHHCIAQALKSNPYQPEFLYVQGVIRAREGDWADAVDSFSRTAAIDPKESDAYYQMGLALERLGRPTQARQAFEHALAIDPNDPDYVRALRTLQASRSK